MFRTTPCRANTIITTTATLEEQRSAVGQAFDQLGQALQSGNLSAAQQAYSSLQQDLQQFPRSRGGVASQTRAQGGVSSVSVNA